MSIGKRAFDHLFPAADELWQRAGAEMTEVTVDDGHVEDVPFFDLEVTGVKVLDDEPFVTRRGRALGRKVLHQVDVNGVDRLVRAYVPNSPYRTDHDFTLTSGSAWMTTIGGYAEHRSDLLFADNQMPAVQVGPPHSATVLPGPLEWLRVPQTISEARNTSIAQTAQEEQLIIAMMTDMYGLPSQQVALGDSRDAILSAAHFPYAAQHGAQIIAFDNKGRSVPQKVEAGDIPRFGRWLAKTGLGGLAASICLAKEGELGTLKGTSSLNPNFLASSLVGAMPALASGEAGRAISWVPRDTHGIEVLYGEDEMSYAEIFKELWAQHANVHIKDVPHGTHGALIHPLAHSGTRQRINRLAVEYREQGAALDSIDWKNIYVTKPNLSVVPPVEPAA